MTLQFPNTPTDGQVYTDTNSGNRWVWDSANTVWKSTSTFTQTITVSSSQPGSPVVGQLWWNQDYGRLFIYYNDGTSNQWVDATLSPDISGIYGVANAANLVASASYNTANAAFGRANTALQNTSGTFSGNMYISGTLGVGATVPDKTLEVAVTNNTTNTHYGIKVSNYSFTTDTRASIVFKNADNNGCAIWSRRTGSASGELYFGTNGGAGIDEINIIERMRIDASGRVTMPYQPIFSAYGSGTQSLSGSQTSTNLQIASQQTLGSRTSSYNTSTYRFTVPIAGTYCFMGQYAITGSSTGPESFWSVNGGSQQYGSINYSGSGYVTTSSFFVWSCAVGDYIEFKIQNNNSTSFTVDLSRTRLVGWLMG